MSHDSLWLWAQCEKMKARHSADIFSRSFLLTCSFYYSSHMALGSFHDCQKCSSWVSIIAVVLPSCVFPIRVGNTEASPKNIPYFSTTALWLFTYGSVVNASYKAAQGSYYHPYILFVNASRFSHAGVLHRSRRVLEASWRRVIPCQINQFSGNATWPVSDVSEKITKHTSMCSNDTKKILDADNY